MFLKIKKFRKVDRKIFGDVEEFERTLTFKPHELYHALQGFDICIHYSTSFKIKPTIDTHISLVVDCFLENSNNYFLNTVYQENIETSNLEIEGLGFFSTMAFDYVLKDIRGKYICGIHLSTNTIVTCDFSKSSRNIYDAIVNFILKNFSTLTIEIDERHVLAAPIKVVKEICPSELMPVVEEKIKEVSSDFQHKIFQLEKQYKEKNMQSINRDVLMLGKLGFEFDEKNQLVLCAKQKYYSFIYYDGIEYSMLNNTHIAYIHKIIINVEDEYIKSNTFNIVGYHPTISQNYIFTDKFLMKTTDDILNVDLLSFYPEIAIGQRLNASVILEILKLLELPKINKKHSVLESKITESKTWSI